MNSRTPIPCPAYLAGALALRWEILSPQLAAMGTVDELNADLLGKYILAENEYLRVSELVQAAIRAGDAEESGKWLTAQDRLTKQILSLGDELGLNPSMRRARGLLAPRK